jgi:hypothetical protein
VTVQVYSDVPWLDIVPCNKDEADNKDVAEEEAYQAAKEMYDRLRPLYTYWNPLDWPTIWHMNNALEDAI